MGVVIKFDGGLTSNKTDGFGLGAIACGVGASSNPTDGESSTFWPLQPTNAITGLTHKHHI
jgi:hypothetical protein